MHILVVQLNQESILHLKMHNNYTSLTTGSINVPVDQVSISINKNSLARD